MTSYRRFGNLINEGELISDINENKIFVEMRQKEMSINDTLCVYPHERISYNINNTFKNFVTQNCCLNGEFKNTKIFSLYDRLCRTNFCCYDLCKCHEYCHDMNLLLCYTFGCIVNMACLLPAAVLCCTSHVCNSILCVSLDCCHCICCYKNTDPRNHIIVNTYPFDFKNQMVYEDTFCPCCIIYESAKFSTHFDTDFGKVVMEYNSFYEPPYDKKFSYVSGITVNGIRKNVVNVHAREIQRFLTRDPSEITRQFME